MPPSNEVGCGDRSVVVRCALWFGVEQNMTTPRPERRRLQFSLRTLLIFVTLVCITMSWLGVKLARVMRQREAVAAIEARGGYVTYDYEVDALPAEWTAPTWLRGLFDDVYVSHVILSGNCDNDDISRLAKLTSLETLDFDHSQLTDAGLAHLSGLADLQVLSLADTQVTDAGLAHLERLANLWLLSLNDTPVTDAGLKHLDGLTNLTTLYLWGTGVTDAGLEHLKGMTNLQLLSLDDTQVTDAGLAHLRGLSNLERLTLGSTQVTDGGLEHLKGLTKLRELILWNTQVTDAGVKELKETLPQVRIEY